MFFLFKRYDNKNEAVTTTSTNYYDEKYSSCYEVCLSRGIPFVQLLLVSYPSLLTEICKSTKVTGTVIDFKVIRGLLLIGTFLLSFRLDVNGCWIDDVRIRSK